MLIKIIMIVSTKASDYFNKYSFCNELFAQFNINIAAEFTFSRTTTSESKYVL